MSPNSRVLNAKVIHSLAIFGYIVLTALMTYPSIFLLGTHIPGGGDAFHWMRELWYFKFVLTNPNLTLNYDPLLFYPEGIPRIAFPSAFNQISYTLLSYFLELPSAYTILWAFSFVISGYGTFLLVRYLTNNNFSAFISGTIFAFSPYHMVHALGHLGATTVQWIPFCALYLIKTMREKKAKYSVISGIFFGLVAASDLQYMVFMGVFSLILILYDIFYDYLVKKDPKVLYGFKVYIPFFLVSAALVLPLTYNEILLATSQQNILKPDPREAIIYSADLLSFFIPSILHPIFGKIVSPIYKNFTGNISENTQYIGYLVLILCIFAIIKFRKDKVVKFWIFSAFCFSLFCLGPILHVNGRTTFTEFNINIPLPYIILNYLVPFLENSRTPGRLFVIAALSFSVLAGYGFLSLQSRYSKFSKKIAIFMLILLIVIFEYACVPYPVSKVKTYEFYKELGKDKDTYAILEVPLTLKYDYGVEIIYFQTIHAKPLVGGQYARLPPDARDFETNMPGIRELTYITSSSDIIVNQKSENLALSVLNYYNIRYIVVHEEYLNNSEKESLNKFLTNVGVSGIQEKDLTIYKVPKREQDLFASIYKNWYYIEYWNQIPTRWISNNATLLIYSPENLSIKLSFYISSFYKPRSIQIILNNAPLYNQTVSTHFEKISLVVPLKKGINEIRFYSPDGCQRPVDIPELKSGDTRCLSFAFQNLIVEPLEPWNFLDIGTKEAEKYLLNGWSGNEISGNTSFVWANALNSSVLVILDDEKPLNLSFRCHPFVLNENVSQEIRLYFNGNFVASLNLKKGWNEYSVQIPAEFTKRGINSLEFKYKYAESPKDYRINEDTRKLAVAFDWIKIN